MKDYEIQINSQKTFTEKQLAIPLIHTADFI